MAWIPPASGELRDLVRFERRGRSTAGGGVARGAWAPLGDPRSARLQPVRGGEEVVAGRLSGVSAWELVVRFDSLTRRVTTADRAVDARDATRVFDVRFAEDLEGRGRWIVMQLQRGTGDGRPGT